MSKSSWVEVWERLYHELGREPNPEEMRQGLMDQIDQRLEDREKAKPPDLEIPRPEQSP